MTATVDIAFPIVPRGTIPVGRYQYPLLGALSRIVPKIHSAPDVGVHPIRGVPVGNGQLQLMRTSAVVIRAPVEFIPDLLPLTGRSLELGGCTIRLGSPRVRSLLPSAAVHCRLVTIKGFMECGPFQEAVIRQLEALGVRRTVSMETGPRRVIHIKSCRVVGFAVTLKELTAEESLLIQARGLGGRRHLACGLFVPSARSPVNAQVSGDAAWRPT